MLNLQESLQVKLDYFTSRDLSKISQKAGKTENQKKTVQHCFIAVS